MGKDEKTFQQAIELSAVELVRRNWERTEQANRESGFPLERPETATGSMSRLRRKGKL